jgi:hypothetical protein
VPVLEILLKFFFDFQMLWVLHGRQEFLDWPESPVLLEVD